MATPNNAPYKKLQKIARKAHRRAYAPTPHLRPGEKGNRTGGKFLGHMMGRPHPLSRGRQKPMIPALPPVYR